MRADYIRRLPEKLREFLNATGLPAELPPVPTRERRKEDCADQQRRDRRRLRNRCRMGKKPIVYRRRSVHARPDAVAARRELVVHHIEMAAGNSKFRYAAALNESLHGLVQRQIGIRNE